MSIKERIIDYENNKEEIDKWIALKGEQKYNEFAQLLEINGVDCTWDALDTLCRYDKRLLVNVFKYMSFFEDYIRAKVWNNGNKSYKSVESQELRETITVLGETKVRDEQLNFIVTNVEYICKLRNQISHNKIMLLCEKDGKYLKELLKVFREALPKDYQEGFTKDINSCVKRLNLNSKMIITI